MKAAGFMRIDKNTIYPLKRNFLSIKRQLITYLEMKKELL